MDANTLNKRKIKTANCLAESLSFDLLLVSRSKKRNQLVSETKMVYTKFSGLQDSTQRGLESAWLKCCHILALNR